MIRSADGTDGTSGTDGTDGDDGPMGEPGRGRGRPRRAPSPQQRERDPERSRARLLDAALEEFAAKGFAGARVAGIAARAGLNTQLVSYYFGGKEGLYRALQEGWQADEATFARPDLPLGDLLAEYLHAALRDLRRSKVLIWEGLSGTGRRDAAADEQALIDLRRRQAQGELGEELDPGFFLLAFMGAILAPVVMPQVARHASGIDPSSPDFETRYADQLRRMLRRLAD